MDILRTKQKPINKVQTRSEKQGIEVHDTVENAFEAAQKDPTIWKISFDASTEERVRLVRNDDGWMYENIFGQKEIGE